MRLPKERCEKFVTGIFNGFEAVAANHGRTVVENVLCHCDEPV